MQDTPQHRVIPFRDTIVDLAQRGYRILFFLLSSGITQVLLKYPSCIILWEASHLKFAYCGEGYRT